MSWNYRVFRHKAKVAGLFDEWYAIHEVYYNAGGQIVAYSPAESKPFGETTAELIADIEMMKEALGKATIDAADLKKRMAARAKAAKKKVSDDVH